MCRDALARWGDKVSREAELEEWQILAGVVTSRGWRMVRGARIHGQDIIIGGVTVQWLGGE